MEDWEEVTVPVVDAPHAPDLYATRAVGMFLALNNVHITLASRRCDHTAAPGPFTDLVVARVVLPLEAAAELGALLVDFTERMKTATAAGRSDVQPHRVLQ